MALAPGKKRYYLTLTQDRFERLQAVLRELGAVKGVESQIVDEMVAGVLQTIEHFLKVKKEQGREPSYGDLLVLLGGLLKDIGEDEQMKL